MIRFIINTTVSKRDMYGNCYNYSTVTSTKTGRRFTVHASYGSSGDNIKSKLRQSGLEWEEINYSECVIPIREFNRLEKNIVDAVSESDVDKSMIISLED